jgi:hypothetical protein
VTLLSLLAACANDGSEADLAVDRLVRASMALRGVRPAVAEMERVAAEPGDVDEVARGWLSDPRVGDTVRDLHAEELLVRIDAQPHPPAIDALAGFDLGAIAASLDEEPLRAIADVVTSGRPYTDILTGTTAMTDPIVAAAYGLTHDGDGPEWQRAWWTDGRPEAGVLASTTLWQRHMSSDTNHHRGRASLVASTFLCDDVESRSNAGIVEPADAEVAVREDPACTVCHAVLDPLASTFAGVRRYVLPGETAEAIALGCPPDLSWACYPITLWDPELADLDATLPPPALYGTPVAGLEELGRAITEDPRFPECTARRFFGYLARVAPADVEPEVASALAAVFVATGYDARELLLAAALHDRFSPDRAPVIQARPEQLARTVEALTGYRWRMTPSAAWGGVDLATTDAYGFRSLMGGVDGWDVVDPEPRPLPTRELAIRWLAEEAASFVVDHDATGSSAARTLLRDGVVDQRGAVRDQIGHLHFAVLGERAKADVLDDTWDLWNGAFARSGRADHAWKVVVAALLQDDRLVSY